MDFVKNLAGGSSDQNANTQQQASAQQGQQSSGGGFMDGIGNKLNAAAGGGAESEKNEDMLDKGMLCSSPSNHDIPLILKSRCRFCSGARPWSRAPEQ